VRAGILLLAVASATACFGGGGVIPIRTAFNKGVYHYSAGEYDEAISEYREALRDDPNDYRARFNLAMALEAKAGTLPAAKADEAALFRRDAETEYRTLLERKPGDLRASINLSAIEYARGQHDAAKARLEATIERYPDVALPRTALATHLINERKPAEALAVLEGALAIDPASLEANMLAGDAERKLGKFDAARRYYKKGLRRESDDLATLLALARLDDQTGRFEDAIQWLDRLLYIDPDHREAHLLAAHCHEQRGAFELAVEHLWWARRIAGGTPKQDREISAQLVELYRRLLERESKRRG